MSKTIRDQRNELVADFNNLPGVVSDSSDALRSKLQIRLLLLIVDVLLEIKSVVERKG